MNKKNTYHTDFLFPNSTFIMGMGSILNIAGNYFKYNYSKTEEQADFRAIKSDWGVVGQDMYGVIRHTPIEALLNGRRTTE